jgi:3D (Asp-Asp-Asp) domain-containing protein
LLEDIMPSALVTAYVATCLGCSGITASGEVAHAADMILAASREWAIGSCVELKLPREGWVQFAVQDRGGAIKGRDRFDMLVGTVSEARAWGKRRIRYRACQVIE